MARILVIDDSLEFLVYLTSLFKRTNHFIVTSTDPRDAFEKMEKDTFDLILIDVNMPGGISGFDVVRSVRKDALKKNIPLVLLTGRRDKVDVQKALDCGADDYIVKPVDAPLLLAKIDGLLLKATNVKFAEGYIGLTGVWESQIQLLHLTEKGMTVWSDLKPPLESVVKIKSDFFQRIGIETPPLRVIETYDDQTQPHRYFTKVNFIGLNDTELQKIRLWVNTHVAA